MHLAKKKAMYLLMHYSECDCLLDFTSETYKTLFFRCSTLNDKCMATHFSCMHKLIHNPKEEKSRCMSLHEFIQRLCRAQSMHLFMNRTQKVYNLHKVLAARISIAFSAYRASNYSLAFVVKRFPRLEICAYFFHAHIKCSF